jgi:predicted nucleic acid-binding protein
MPILIDSNVILDLLTRDPTWFEWSARTLEHLAESHTLHINAVIYAEVSICFERIEDLEAALPIEYLSREPIPYAAEFLAGKCFVDYRRRGGVRSSPLPDFFIGAHAAVNRWTLMTRDEGRYATYFPRLPLITPRNTL